MVHHENFPFIAFIPLIIAAVFVITWFYLMLNKPEQWLEWFINRPYRWWGMQVTIVDKERFRKATRIYAMIPLLMAIIGAFAALIAFCTTQK